MDNNIQQWEYVVKFTFTTFDLRKSMAMLRGGKINITSKVVKEEIDAIELKQLCVNTVLETKPNWNILGLDIESIETSKCKRPKINTNG